MATVAWIGGDWDNHKDSLPVNDLKDFAKCYKQYDKAYDFNTFTNQDKNGQWRAIVTALLVFKGANSWEQVAEQLGVEEHGISSLIKRGGGGVPLAPDESGDWSDSTDYSYGSDESDNAEEGDDVRPAKRIKAAPKKPSGTAPHRSSLESDLQPVFDCLGAPLHLEQSALSTPSTASKTRPPPFES